MENIKSKYNNYTFARGKLGDFFIKKEKLENNNF
jgi:hypothetical protein